MMRKHQACIPPSLAGERDAYASRAPYLLIRSLRKRHPDSLVAAASHTVTVLSGPLLCL